MSQQQNEVWQVMVEGQVYETNFNGLVQWHLEGCFHPSDFVRKEGRNWIEAGKVPAMQRIFNGTAFAAMSQPNAPAQPVQPSSQQSVYSHQPQGFQSPQSFQQPQGFQPPSNQPAQVPQSNNSFMPPQQNSFAGPQPPQPSQPGFNAPVNNFNANSFQGNYEAHPDQSYDPYASQTGGPAFGYNQAPPQQTGWTAPPPPASMAAPNACLNHPNVPARHICRMCSSLFCNECPKKMGMNVMICPVCGDMCKDFTELQKKSEVAYRKSQGYGLEDLGQSLIYPFKFPASLIGGALLYSIFLLGGIVGRIIASMLLFGCIVIIIRQVAWGRIHKNFLATIGENGVFDDLIKPGFLGLGVTLVSWGPAIIAVLLLIFYVMGAASRAIQQRSVPQRPPALELQAQPNMESVKERYPDNSIQSERNLENQPPLDQDGMPDYEPQNGGSGDFMRQVVAGSLPLILLFLLGVVWGLFYYPMALTIAGYTQDFLSTINPLVGLDTMKRMGGTYLKAFGMYIVVMIISVALNWVSLILTLPFNTPFGNIPYNLISGAIYFYSSMVIACLLGLALFKCADSLGIETD